jgi:hypothetical protein
MALARVVTFDGVSAERMAELTKQMESEEPPAEIPAKEILMLHDPEAQKSVVVLFFDNDADYRQGDATLSAMPTGDTPGQRTSVGKYDVAFRTSR